MIVLALLLTACHEDDEPQKDCTPLKSEMDLAAITLFNVERQNPYNYGATPTKQEVDTYNLTYELVFDAYTQSVTNYHNCKHQN